jgi:hypothetical protein
LCESCTLRPENRISLLNGTDALSDEEKMPEDLMRYDVLAQHALRSVVKMALQRVARDGALPGEHHFFISFDTNFDGASVSPRIKARYPDDMTIVLQHQFSNLHIFDKYFEVELSFDNISERLVIPFAAIKGFFDPTVQFGLQFEPGALDEGEEAADDSEDTRSDDKGTAASPGPGINNANDAAAPGKASNDDTTVVSLDAFRKK